MWFSRSKKRDNGNQIIADREGANPKGVFFRPAVFHESAKPLENPGRGWYQLYSFDVTEKPDVEELRWCLCKEEQLALVQLDIGRFRSEPLSAEALEHVKQILDFFRCAGKQMIVRIVYDREGRGMEHEPSALEQVINHMCTLGPLLAEYASAIFTLQGLFVGSWGEMHNSKFLTPKHLRKLAETLWESTRGSCYLAVRRPVQRRIICAGEPPWQNAFGLFDDAILASVTHLGTFGEPTPEKEREPERKRNPDFLEAWSPAAELAFEYELCRRVPNGGEAVYGEYSELLQEEGKHSESEAVLARLAQMHICYLNCVYDGRILQEWKDTVYQNADCYRGMSLYEYIGCHLGYRFVVRNADIHMAAGQMNYRIEVANVGFGNLFEAADVYLVLAAGDVSDSSEHQGQEQCHLLSVDAGTWDSGEVSVISGSIPAIKEACRVFLRMYCRSNRKPIRFANTGAEEMVYLGDIALAAKTVW